MGGTITSDVAVFTKLKKLELNRMRLDGKMVVPGLAASYVADFHVFFATGPPLHESIKLLSPLTNLEELSLGGNKLGGTITSDVAVFTKLKKLALYSMELDGKIGSTRSEFFIVLSWRIRSFAGQLPELGKLQNLTYFDVSNNMLLGRLSTRTERFDRRD